MLVARATSSPMRSIILRSTPGMGDGTQASRAACTPTVRVEVAPINIYAKLDANVRLQLDEDVKALVKWILALK